MSEYHTPVMLDESVSALVINPDGVYADATFGGGGHTAGIKCHGQKIARSIVCQHERNHIKEQQHSLQWDSHYHAEQSHDQEKCHPSRHRHNQNTVGNGLDLVRQYLQVRFRDGNHKS